MKYTNFISLLTFIFVILSCGCYEKPYIYKEPEIYSEMNDNNDSPCNNNIFLDHDKPKSYPNMHGFPKNYYKISDKIYPDVRKRDLDTLKCILRTIKLPSYKKNYYDCSEASCQLEWILEGYGFKTYLVYGILKENKEKFGTPHMWVAVKLDNGKIVAIESTYLCENHYYPNSAIFCENYNLNNVINYGNYYYYPEFYADTPDMLLTPYKNIRILITQLDWWNHPKNIKIKKKIFNI